MIAAGSNNPTLYNCIPRCTTSSNSLRGGDNLKISEDTLPMMDIYLECIRLREISCGGVADGQVHIKQLSGNMTERKITYNGLAGDAARYKLANHAARVGYLQKYSI